MLSEFLDEAVEGFKEIRPDLFWAVELCVLMKE